MSVFEVHCGPVDRRYLMKKSKDELATLVLELMRTSQDAARWRAYRVSAAAAMSGLHSEKLDEAVDKLLAAREKNHDAN